ncbi:U6 snRNA-associated Sm-like protein LSm6 isoform X1 [Silurus meridionalis]|nr:U6 snRNA-associated Sm-like protein LSm6 isoform X1 [Silurus meridionalis]
MEIVRLQMLTEKDKKLYRMAVFQYDNDLKTTSQMTTALLRTLKVKIHSGSVKLVNFPGRRALIMNNNNGAENGLKTHFGCFPLPDVKMQSEKEIALTQSRIAILIVICAGVICDRRVSARVKEKVHRTVVRPEMLYGLETVALSKRQEAELEVAELKMLRFSLGVTTMYRIRNEFIRGTAPVGRFGDKVREVRLRWFGHVQRRDMGYISRRMLRMEPPGRRKRGRPKRRFMDVVKEDMQDRGHRDHFHQGLWELRKIFMIDQVLKMSVRKQTPSDFLKQIIGRPVVVKLNSGVDYRGEEALSISGCSKGDLYKHYT